MKRYIISITTAGGSHWAGKDYLKGEVYAKEAEPKYVRLLAAVNGFRTRIMAQREAKKIKKRDHTARVEVECFIV